MDIFLTETPRFASEGLYDHNFTEEKWFTFAVPCCVRMFLAFYIFFKPVTNNQQWLLTN